MSLGRVMVDLAPCVVDLGPANYTRLGDILWQPPSWLMSTHRVAAALGHPKKKLVSCPAGDHNNCQSVLNIFFTLYIE